MAFRFIIDYIRHYLTSNSRHGTHSPFVYKLTDEVIYDFKFKTDYTAIENQRKKLLNDDSEVEVTDLGAGSQLNRSRIRKVRDIAANALKRPRLAQLIYRLAKENHPENLVELGTCLGITTSYLAVACPQASVITIEGCGEISAVAGQTFNELGLEHVDLRVGNFDDVFPGIIEKAKKLDFVYVDGNHRKDATLNYFNWCLPKIHERSLIVFDDIYWSRGMKDAWAEIKRHPQVVVTVDLFWIGLVYFRKGQAKEDFKIRF